jgi:hypothetical protein
LKPSDNNISFNIYIVDGLRLIIQEKERNYYIFANLKKKYKEKINED